MIVILGGLPWGTWGKCSASAPLIEMRSRLPVDRVQDTGMVAMLMLSTVPTGIGRAVARVQGWNGHDVL